jgi:hypothetical protein
LHGPRAQLAGVAEAVGMLHRALQHVGDRLDPPVRVPRESPAVSRRIVVAEIVEQEKRIEFAWILKAEGAVQVHARPFHGGTGGAGF